MPSEETQFKPGNAGRPKGSRNKLSEAFIRALAEDFEKHGEDAIKAVRDDKPESYLGVIGRLMPKLLELSGPDGGNIPLAGKLKLVKSRSGNTRKS